MLLLPRLRHNSLRAQQVMVEFANGFDLLLQVLIIGEPAAHFLKSRTLNWRVRLPP